MIRFLTKSVLLRACLLGLSVFLVLPTAALANGFVKYVDIRRGNNGNSGDSPTQAWKTLHYAFSQIGSGDTLRVMAGVYSVANGEPNTPLNLAVDATIEGEPEGSAIIDGTGATAWPKGLICAVNAALRFLTFRNFATYGLEVRNSMPSLDKCSFKDNGTGVYVGHTGLYSASPSITNCIFSANSLYGIQIVQSVTGYSVGAMIQHNTLDGHVDGIYIGGDSAYLSVFIRYNILVNSSGYGVNCAAGGGVTSLDYNNGWQNAAGNATGVAWPAPNNQTADPSFRAGYRLNAGSPCVDKIPPATGDPIFDDHEGRPRPVNTNFDIGAYEYRPLLSQSLTFAPGTTAQDYRIASMPLDPEDATPNVVLGPYVEPYDITQVRVGHWDPYLAAYEEYPFTGDDPILPGDSAWFLFRNGQTMTLTGYKAPTMPDPYWGQPACGIPVKKGWNQVGNPFQHPVDVGQISVLDLYGGSSEPLSAGCLTQGIFWVYVGGVYMSALKLDIGQGGWVYSNVDDAEIFFRDQSVPYPDLAPDQAYDPAPDSALKPPPPPGAFNAAGGGGGGGSGGCFLETAR
ncbi:MAG: right-handed parallel beta-helix repeat-containing protein [Thermodesulfobacteriota bacterium]